jgi:hypothetical protein
MTRDPMNGLPAPAPNPRRFGAAGCHGVVDTLRPHVSAGTIRPGLRTRPAEACP